MAIFAHKLAICGAFSSLTDLSTPKNCRAIVEFWPKVGWQNGNPLISSTSSIFETSDGRKDSFSQKPLIKLQIAGKRKVRFWKGACFEGVKWGGLYDPLMATFQFRDFIFANPHKLYEKANYRQTINRFGHHFGHNFRLSFCGRSSLPSEPNSATD